MVHQKRYAHLAYRPDFIIGDKIKRGMKIGRMGSTGKSNANHIHSDLIQTYGMLEMVEINNRGVYRLDDIPRYIIDLPELMLQYSYFLDGELYGFPENVENPVVITSYFGDPSYLNGGEFEFHPAYDHVPFNRHSNPGLNSDIYWNRSPVGTVMSVGWDNAYGWYICIAY